MYIIKSSLVGNLQSLRNFSLDFKSVLIVLIIFNIIVSISYGLPVVDSNQINLDNASVGKNVVEDCSFGSELRNTCEKCAKLTKSDLAYSMCCSGKDGVRSWCFDFLNYSLDDK